MDPGSVAGMTFFWCSVTLITPPSICIDSKNNPRESAAIGGLIINANYG